MTDFHENPVKKGRFPGAKRVVWRKVVKIGHFGQNRQKWHKMGETGRSFGPERGLEMSENDDFLALSDPSGRVYKPIPHKSQ